MSGLPITIGRQSSTGFHWNTCSTIDELNAAATQKADSVFLTALGPDECGRQEFGPEKFDRVLYLNTEHTMAFQISEIWKQFPPSVAVRVAPPELFGIVRISAESLRESGGANGPFQDVSHPVWDWLIRQLDADPTITLQDKSWSNGGSLWRLPPLVPSRPGREFDWLREHLLSGELVPSPASPVDAIALRAGLLQIHDFLEESHELSQSIEGEGRHVNGDYWHAVMHRREPDYGNAKYWFRRVGQHPLFSELTQGTHGFFSAGGDAESVEWQERLGTPSTWDAFAFVDMCEACADREDSSLGLVALFAQWCEMQLLLEHTFRDAVGE